MKLLALGLVAGLLGSAASATTIPGLFNTGTNADGTGVSVGAVADAHWALIAPGSEAVAWNGGSNGSFPLNGPWLAENSTSRWLTPTGNAGDSLDPSTDGFYTFRLSFNLTGFRPGTASFAGRFAADNAVSSATLNGNPITLDGPGAFSSWTGFTSGEAGFLPGQNTLEFTLRNVAQANGNPAGLRVEFLTSNVLAVPEPASWAMLIAGFGLVGATARRRKAVLAA